MNESKIDCKLSRRNYPFLSSVKLLCNMDFLTLQDLENSSLGQLGTGNRIATILLYVSILTRAFNVETYHDLLYNI